MYLKHGKVFQEYNRLEERTNVKKLIFDHINNALKSAPISIDNRFFCSLITVPYVININNLVYCKVRDL